MAVKIRLKKMGTKNRTFFRIVVSDVRAPRDGRVIEELGIYDPIKNPALIKVDKDRALYWLGKGAQPTETVHSILKKEGIPGK
ncbi:MAG: 30S ribosomal protein S16 [Candidatus Omnitrophica bacterium]|nr:30S ribosomal protein S16 [Candidatus Omnitrophota bacterium]